MAYNQLKPVHIIDNVSTATSITSGAVEILLQDNIGIQLKWSGTTAGTFAFQISADHLEDAEGNILNAGNWISLTVSPPIVAAGSPDDAYVDFNQLSARYIRIVFTRSGGTGALNAYVIGKAV